MCRAPRTLAYKGNSWLSNHCSCLESFAFPPGEIGHTSDLFNYSPHNVSLSITYDFLTDDQKAFLLIETEFWGWRWMCAAESHMLSDFIGLPQTKPCSLLSWLCKALGASLAISVDSVNILGLCLRLRFTMETWSMWMSFRWPTWLWQTRTCGRFSELCVLCEHAHGQGWWWVGQLVVTGFRHHALRWGLTSLVHHRT